uniref:PET domain-containing protein n=1 Tax=Steinernema glaseri TaxID=37863 RepID=A0A1I7YGX2_9BILA
MELDVYPTRCLRPAQLRDVAMFGCAVKKPTTLIQGPQKQPVPKDLATKKQDADEKERLEYRREHGLRFSQNHNCL